MTSFGSWKPPASLAKTLRNTLQRLIGKVQWEPPAWSGSLFQRLVVGCRYIAADRKRWVAALSIVLAASVALAWYALRPKPNYVAYTVTPPKLTEYDENGISNIYPLTVDFEDSVAPLANIDKKLTSGIQISPAFEGDWIWRSGKQLEFVPNSDWPIDQTFTVKMSRKGFFAPEAQLEDYTFKFKTPPFTASITKGEFYQDPQNPALKKIVATVSFSHPVDTSQLEQRITLTPAKDAAYLGLSPDSKNFTVAYDKFKLFAYIHSAALGLPRDDTSITVVIARGVRAARGGNPTAQRLETTIAVPGRMSLRFTGVEMTLVDNARYEPEQILLLRSSSPVPEQAFAGKVQAYLLPVRHPRQPKEDKEPYHWFDPSEIGNDILSKSEPVPLTYVPSDEGAQLTHGFRFNAPVGRYLYFWLKEGIQGAGGYISAKPLTTTVKVIPYRAALNFLGNGALLSLSGDRKVGFLVRDVERVRVEVGRVLPNQLHHLAARMWNYSRPYIDNVEDSIVERFTYVRSYRGQPPGKPIYESIDLGRYLQTAASVGRGLFLLRIVSLPPARTPQAEEDPDEDRYYEHRIEDTRLILLTDLGFIVKQSLDGSRDVFVQSLHRGEPVSGARVEILGRNGEGVASAVTDSSGRAHFPKLPNLRREKTPLLVLVQKDSDYSFMPIYGAGRDLNYSRFDIGGAVNPLSPQQLSTYLFTDRGIYRPGETTHLAMITRTADWRSSLAGLSLDLEITGPLGNIVRRQKIKLSETAFEEVAFTTEPSSPTGDYQAVVWLPRDEKRRDMLGSTSFNVQEFEPDRLHVRLDLAEKSVPGWLTPADVKARVSVMHLFGLPASGRRVNGEMTLSPFLPRFERYPDHRFHIAEVIKEPYNEELSSKTTDANGNAELALDLKRFTGRAYRLSVLARAFEAESGRSVASQNTAIVANAPYLVGVKPDGDLSFIRRGSARQSHWIAVNQQLNPVAAGPLTLEWVHRRYLSVLTEQPDRTFKYVSRLKETVRESRSVRIPEGGTNFPLPTQEPGDFALVLRNAEGAELNRLTYTVVGDANLSRSLERNAELQVQLDKPAYAGGDTITVSIRAPYAGAGLITIERDRVYHHQWFRASTTSSVHRITLPPGFEGNGYVNVQFLRDPASEEIFLSPLSYGVAPFAADVSSRTQQVQLSAQRQLRPGSPLILRVAPAEPSRLTVFAVDEGILQVARYRNPDPLGFFFQKRMLQVETTQILDLILPEFRRFLALAAPGGDAGADYARHLNPFNRKRKPPVAWWSGIIDAGPNGRELRYTVPDYFNGRLRILAVAVNPRRAGVAVATTEVQGDFILTPNVPAMVAPGDEFTVSVGVFNNTASEDPVRVEVQPSRELTSAGPSTAELRIPARREAAAEFRFKANPILGAATLRFTATRGKAQARIEESISVRPAVAYRTQLTLGRFDSSSVEVKLKRDLFPAQRTVEASISAVPLVWGDALVAYLDTFPYPCTEQLVSKGFAALLLASRPDWGRVKSKEAQPIVSTIAMLQSRSNDAGGFGLWTSSPQSAEFPTVYGAHFLLEARERGQEIPTPMLNALTQWLIRFASSPASTLEDGRLRAYAAYLLARQGFLPAAAVSNVEQELSKRHTQTWPSDLAAAYLAATYRLMQRNADAARIIRGVPWSQTGSRSWEGVYYDPVIHDAQLLYLLARHFPDRLGAVPQTVLDGIGQAISGDLISSLSASYTLLALDAYAKTAAPKLKLGVVFGGKPQPSLLRVPVPVGVPVIQFTREGTLPAYYAVSESGFDRNPPSAEVKRELELIHEFVDFKNNPVTKVKVGDEFWVRIRLRTTSRERASQVAVVDLLPGGVEPTLDRVTGPGTNWAPHYVDRREDRVLLFGDVARDVATYLYRVRATNPGVFQVPPAFAEGMYDRRITGMSKAFRLEIVKAP